MKQFVRKVKDNVLLFSEGERLVRDATSNEPWGASSTLMHQIADLTCQREHYESVTNMLWKRLTDVTYPRHVLKACLLVEFLLRNGSERFVHDMKQRRRRFEALSKFTDYAENPEIGADVRAKTVHILALLDDDAKRNEERVTAARTKAKIHGMGNTTNNFRPQSGGSQRQDDWASGNDLKNSPKSESHNRMNSDDDFEAKFGKPDSKAKAKKGAEQKDSGSFGFDDDPLEDDDASKSKETPKASKNVAERQKVDSAVSEKKKTKKKNQDSGSESKPKKDKKKKKKESKQDGSEAANPDPPSGHEDIGEFISADKSTGISKQMSQMSFQASFDVLDSSSQQTSQVQQQPKQRNQPQAQQSPASFDFFSSLESQNISQNNASHNEWFDSKPTAKTPEVSAANGNAFFEEFQSASTVPAKITPNQSPVQSSKKPDDIWSSLTNIDSLAAPKTQQPAGSTVPGPFQKQNDAFLGMTGQQVPNQVAFNNANGFYNGYPNVQQPQYGMPYGQPQTHPAMMQGQIPQQGMYPMMMQGQVQQTPMQPIMMQAPYQQAFANQSPQSGFPGVQNTPAFTQQQKPQSNLNIPDAFAAFGLAGK